MRTIKKVIPSKNDEEIIGEDELLEIGIVNISPRGCGCLKGKSLYLNKPGGEFEVVIDDQGVQVLICKKIKS